MNKRIGPIVKRVANSETIFGEILPLWLNFKSLWVIFDMVYLVFGKRLFVPTLAIFYATGQILIVVNGQRLKNNLAIWSHCLPCMCCIFFGFVISS